MIRSTEDSTQNSLDQKNGIRDLPRPHVKKMWWPFPLVWILPLAAAGLTAYYGYTHLQDRGEQIVVKFTDASGLKAGETMVTHLGVQIGQVMGIALSSDKRTVLVSITLVKSQGSFAKKGAIYWTVRPQFSVENISGLNTVLSGPYIEAIPGNGQSMTEFDGLQKAPANEGPGVNLVLRTPRVDHLSPDAAIYYRGVEVGTIRDIQLSPDATGIDVHIFIRHRYAILVQTDSKFWLVKAADIKGGLFSGVQFKLGSLQALVSGGVAFATPDSGVSAAREGDAFPLYDDMKKDWMDWSPHLPIPAEDSKTPDNPADTPHVPEAAKSLVN